jgi:deoxyribose-phosphate aldolase
MKNTLPSLAELERMLENVTSLRKGELAWLGRIIDHTLLQKQATAEQLARHCDEAVAHSLYAVCVHPEHIAFCAKKLAGKGVKLVSVAGFPTGEDSTADKVSATLLAIKAGADEVDMVLNNSLLRKRELAKLLSDIQAVVQSAQRIPVKVILETCLLSPAEISMAGAVAKAAGAAFLKTSTGFSTGGATVEAVNLLRDVAGGDMGVKASGGIRTLESALRMVLAGADRIGTSAGPSLVSGNSSLSGQTGVY